MTAFFMLSGFSLYITYEKNDLCCKKELAVYYKKRAFSILPMYYIVTIIFLVFIRKECVSLTVAILPIEIFGMQSTYSSLFSFFHNGGTWFVSCLLICYLLYPFVQTIVKIANVRERIIIGLLAGGGLLYSPIIVWLFKTERTYSNPYYRLLEFIVGAIIASLRYEPMRNRLLKKHLYTWYMFLVEFIFYIIGVSIGRYYGIGSTDNYMLYSWVGLPLFSLMLISLSGVDSNILQKSKLFKYSVDLSYCFFLAQIFSNRICRVIILQYNISNNVKKTIGVEHMHFNNPFIS